MAVNRDVMTSLLLMLVEQKLERFNMEDQIVRLTNSLVVRIIENADHTRLVTAQVRMLHECISNANTQPKLTELVMKSLWKVMRVMEQWQQTLDFSAVLNQVNHFLLEFPSHSWKERKDLTPLKTIKTLVHTMAQVQPSALLTYLKQHDACHELHKIINKYISTSGVQIGGGKEQQPASPHRLSKSTHHQLSAIFKQIGSKDHTREGLEQLYEFQKMHPEADIAPFLEKASHFFQEYIEKGLRTIKRERSSASALPSFPHGTQ